MIEQKTSVPSRSAPAIIVESACNLEITVTASVPGNIRSSEQPQPGAVLHGLLAQYNQTVVTAARLLRVSRQQLHRITSEKAAVRPEMAIRLGKLFGTGPQFWLQMQSAVDLKNAQRKLAAELDLIPTRHSL